MGCSFINDFVDPDFNKRIEMRIEEGFKEGMEKKEIEIIENLLNKGFSAEEISDMINISIERINNL